MQLYSIILICSIGGDIIFYNGQIGTVRNADSQSAEASRIDNNEILADGGAVRVRIKLNTAHRSITKSSDRVLGNRAIDR